MKQSDIKTPLERTMTLTTRMEKGTRTSWRRCLVLLGPAVLAACPMVSPAQERMPAPALTTAPAPAATLPATRPEPLAADQGEAYLTSAPTTQIMLNFKDASIDAVLEHLSQVAGFIVVKEVPVSGRVTVFSRQPVSPAESVDMLNSVLKVNGYTAIQMGRILKITSLDKAKKSSIPVHFGNDPNKIEQTDELITQVIPVRSVDAVKLRQDLQPLVGTDADLSANGGSNSIIITDTSANIRRVVEIISSLDKRDALENTIRVRQMKYADAAAAAKLVTEIFNADQNQQNNNSPAQFFRNFRRGGRGGGGQNGQAQGSEEGRTGKVIASADTRTNTIVVTGPTDTLQVIDDMLEKLDANPATEQAFFIYALKNGQSQNMAAVLNSLFGASTGTSGVNSRTTGGISNLSNTRSTFGSVGGGGVFGSSSSGGGRGGRSGGFGGSGTSGGFGNSTPINRSANPVAANVSPAIAGAASQLAGQVYVVADADTNSLLVSTASKYEQQVRDIIKQLDRPVPQVLIKVLIAEVTHNNSEDLGVDFSVLNTRASGNGQTVGTSFLTPPPTGGLVVSMLETNVTATLRALAVAGKLDVLSRPYILASDNQLASITVGQEVPIITDSRLDLNNNPINSISYRDIGIILNVTPHINPEGLVILDVSPEVSSITDQTVPISSTVSAPVFALRSADSRVGIKDGETIVIGGMMEDRKTQTVNKVPILGDIPLLGLLFQRNQITKTKTELLIFLTPHVAQAPDKLQGMSQDEMGGVKLVPNAVQPGTFEDHMRGLQRGSSTTQPATQLVAPEMTAPRPAGATPEPPLPGTR